MRHMRMGLGLVAAFALSAVCASSALAAAPEFKVCGKAGKTGKAYTGHYTDKACSVKATPTEETEGKKNKYERLEFSKAKKKSFKGANVGAPKLYLINPGTKPPGEIAAEVTCEKEKVTGEVTGAKTEKFKVAYTGCFGKAPKYGLEGPCSNTNVKKAEIQTEELEGTLVFLNSAKTAVGVRAKAAVGSKYLARFECINGVVGIETTGELLLERKGDVNAASKSWETVGAEGTFHTQKPYYEEEKNGTGAPEEVYGFEYFGEASAFQTCAKEKVKELKITQAEAEAACAGEGKAPKKEKPVSLVANTFGAQEQTAPSTQISTTKSSGEAFLVET